MEVQVRNATRVQRLPFVEWMPLEFWLGIGWNKGIMKWENDGMERDEADAGATVSSRPTANGLESLSSLSRTHSFSWDTIQGLTTTIYCCHFGRICPLYTCYWHQRQIFRFSTARKLGRGKGPPCCRPNWRAVKWKSFPRTETSRDSAQLSCSCRSLHPWRKVKSLHALTRVQRCPLYWRKLRLFRGTSWTPGWLSSVLLILVVRLFVVFMLLHALWSLWVGGRARITKE